MEWYFNASMHDFEQNSQLQFTSSCLVRVPTEIVEHVCDAAGVPMPVCDKSCGSSSYHFDPVFMIPLVCIPDSTTVIPVGSIQVK